MRRKQADAKRKAEEVAAAQAVQKRQKQWWEAPAAHSDGADAAVEEHDDDVEWYRKEVRSTLATCSGLAPCSTQPLLSVARLSQVGEEPEDTVGLKSAGGHGVLGPRKAHRRQQGGDSAPAGRGRQKTRQSAGGGRSGGRGGRGQVVQPKRVVTVRGSKA